MTSWHGNIFRSPVVSPHKGTITLRFHIFFDVRLNKQLNKPSSCQWFETPGHPCDVIVLECYSNTYAINHGVFNSHRAPSSVCGFGSSRTGPQRVVNGLYLLAFAPRRPDSRGCGFHVCKVIFSSSEANEYTGWWQSVTYLDMMIKSRDYVYRIREYIVPGYIYIYIHIYICISVCVCVCVRFITTI